ncbi:hypothetical protein E6C60_3694 [Paenibacillus algicola]|uniref:Stage II sporulation protein M n=1 Tax=Paenibacillus algicola TaxID=2565926 RepID=A0A4P8XRG3_9BACL|nr:stage II sporulation protein M [Paenibacillus algicola]QCT04401.1 hypothetical protein E6C60_3694 [Paenibacillus algicola]
MYRFTTFLKDLGTIRGALIVSAVLFVLAVAAGWNASQEIQEILAGEIQALAETSQNLSASDNPELSFFVFIFLNNAIKSLIVMFAGLLLGIIPFVFLAMNGMVLGFLMELVRANGGDLNELIFKGLLPHGIIEIPVLIIAGAYGLMLGALVIRSILPGQEKGEALGLKWRTAWKKTGTASLWILILLFVAAIIESTITLWLMS